VKEKQKTSRYPGRRNKFIHYNLYTIQRKVRVGTSLRQKSEASWGDSLARTKNSAGIRRGGLNKGQGSGVSLC